ncbi:hypothetical protein [Virgisporangium aliadipatigenens]|uniref:hypothetical protein n=1 Tax=Virgisporangium aliadipatigenens TaxID=741659 RepID=UPI0019459B10|nr:hypothetical protein [Virgisporangium aliadipatigenens]
MSGFEGEAGVGGEPVEEVDAVLDALEPVLDDRLEVVDAGDGEVPMLPLSCDQTPSVGFQVRGVGGEWDDLQPVWRRSSAASRR